MAENQSTVQKVSVFIQLLTFHTHTMADAITDGRTDGLIKNRAPVLRTKELGTVTRQGFGSFSCLFSRLQDKPTRINFHFQISTREVHENQRN